MPVRFSELGLAGETEVGGVPEDFEEVGFFGLGVFEELGPFEDLHPAFPQVALRQENGNGAEVLSQRRPNASSGFGHRILPKISPSNRRWASFETPTSYRTLPGAARGRRPSGRGRVAADEHVLARGVAGTLQCSRRESAVAPASRPRSPPDPWRVPARAPACRRRCALPNHRVAEHRHHPPVGRHDARHRLHGRAELGGPAAAPRFQARLEWRRAPSSFFARSGSRDPASAASPRVAPGSRSCRGRGAR